MDDPTPDQLEEALLDFQAAHYDERRVAAFVKVAVEVYPDRDRVLTMLRQGAEPLVRPPVDGMVECVLAYSEFAEALAVEEPPARGSDERGVVLGLAKVPTSALASLPRG